MKQHLHSICHTITIHDVYQSRNLDCLQKFLTTIHSTHKSSFISLSINRRDSFGRTILHKLAASDHQSESLDWWEIISKNPYLQINLPDLESGWTPLHRALYHGNLSFAKALIDNSECDPSVKDHEGLLAFELYMLTIGGPTRPISNNQFPLEPCNSDLFTWGSNRNFLLGIHDDGDRHYPERIHLKRLNTSDYPANHTSQSIPYTSNGVRFVAMSRLHTALITSEGELRVCGFGSGGRLGLTSIPKPNNNQINPYSISAETQFTFAPVKGGGLASQRVNFVALGQDHTVVVTNLGQVFTFGMNRFGQLGYAPESPGTCLESMIQVEPKRVAGLLKKVDVLGAAASRWHTAVFSSDSLYTWGANRGQLGYPHPHPHNSSCPLQITPRKVSIAHTSIIQLSCMEYETAYLCENSSDVYILKSDVTIRVIFPFERFPSDMRVSILPTTGQSLTPRIVHIHGSDHTLAALSSLGDVYILDLEQSNGSKNQTNHLSISSSPHRSNVTSTSSGPTFKPHRVWTSTKWFNAAKSAKVGMDGDLIVVTMSGDVHIGSKRSGNISKGLETRSFESSSINNNFKKNYKFQRVPYLQRVSQVAASPTGSYAAIRDDIQLDNVRQTSPEEDGTLPSRLATMLSHIKRQATLVPELHMVPSLNVPSKLTSNNLFPTGHDALHSTENESDADEDIVEKEEVNELTWDARVGSALVGLSLNWIDHRLNDSLDDGDIFLVARSGEKILVHRFILCSRSNVLGQIINTLITVDGIKFHPDGQTDDTAERGSSFNLPLLSFDCHSLLTLLLLVHYLYTDHFPCLWDGRVWPQIENTHKEFLSTTRKVSQSLNSIPILVNETKVGLKNLATSLSLPALEQCLGRHGKSTPKASLSRDFRAILPGLGVAVDITEEVNFDGNHNLQQENLEDHLQISKSHNLNPDIELELKDGVVLKCHSILMRAQCPFFRLMYDQGVWVKGRRKLMESSGNKNLIRLDMGHLTKDVMQVILQHVYTDDAENLFSKKDFHSLNEYIDFVFDVMAVANELMMDKLKFICSVVLRRCVNLLNVTAIAAEAEFYRADSLKEICMNHIIFNLEGIFQDSKGLSNIPDDLLLSLSKYLKKFQKNQFPICRSTKIIDELMRRHSEFLLELDLPTCGSKISPTSHHWKSLTKLLANSSQTPLDADLCNKSSPEKNFTRGLTDIGSQPPRNHNFSNSDMNVPEIGAAVDKIDPKPLNLGDEITDDVAPFVMDDVEAEVGSTQKTPKWGSSSISDRSAWANPIKKVKPLDIRATISTEKQRGMAGASNLNRDHLGYGSPVRLPSDYMASNQKLSQREKRRLSAEASKSKSESISSINQTHQAKLTAWRSISNGDRKNTSGEIDNTQALPPLVSSASPSSPNFTSILGPNKRDKTQNPNSTSAFCSGRTTLAKHSPEPNDPASAVGAAIITPTRVSTKATATRQFSRRTLGGQDTPWTNYASSCSNFICPVSLSLNQSDSASNSILASTNEIHHHQHEGRSLTKLLAVNDQQTQIDGMGMGNESTTKPSNFSIIQELQAQESWALYGPGRKMNKPNLIQIQEEENQKLLEKKQEDQFLKWFEEESQRVRKQQQEEEQQHHQLESRLRSKQPSNKKSNSDHLHAHRDRKGNSSKNHKEKRIDHQGLNENSKAVDHSPKPNNNCSKSANTINPNITSTTQAKNKKKLPTSSGVETEVKSSKPRSITSDNHLSNLITKPQHSNLKSKQSDHYVQHPTLSGVHA